MKTLILLLSLSALPAFAQCGKQVLNPATGKMDCIGPGPFKDANGNVAIGTMVLTSCTGVDDTVKVQAAMDATGAVELPPATCVVSNLVPTRNIQLRGSGPTSILSFKAGSTGTMIDGSTFGVRLQGVVLDGGLSSTQAGTVAVGTRSGVTFNAAVRDSGLFNVTVRGFSNIGIGLAGTSTLMFATPVLSGVNAYWNYIGIETRIGASGTEGEYSRITGCAITENRYGINIHSGNTMVVGNTVNNNGYGISILSSSNDGHGTLVGNTINHQTVAGLTVTNIATGYTIIGNQFFYGDWAITGSSGLTIANNSLAVTNMTLTGGGGNRLAGNFLYATPTITGGEGFVITDNQAANGTYYGGLRSVVGVTTSLVGTGGELLSNGNFVDGTGWGLGTGWSIGSNKASQSGTGGSLLSHALSSVVDGTTYVITYTITGGSGAAGLRIGIGGATESLTFTGANGTYTQTLLVASHSNTNLYIRSDFGNSNPFAVSAVSVRVGGIGITAAFMPPTSCAGQATGALWNNAGTPAICP